MFFALILHGGQLSVNLQLVKIALLILVKLPFFFEELPNILGSFFSSLKIFFFTKIFVSLATNSLVFKLNIPSLKL
jgi:hypothetical protein